MLIYTRNVYRKTDLLRVARLCSILREVYRIIQEVTENIRQKASRLPILMFLELPVLVVCFIIPVKGSRRSIIPG